MRHLAAAALCAAVLWAGAASVRPAAGAPLALRVRGVCWEAGGRIGAGALQPVAALGATWISQTPFGWMAAVDRPGIRLATGGVLGFGPFWGETDAGLSETTRLAHARGLKVLLIPHLWVHGGAWRGDVRMRTPRDWEGWFRDYRTFIVHYARLAERDRTDMLCVGTELKGTSSREADWRAVIAAVRREYHGPLVYAANWDAEVDSIGFWDALDAIGVQAYYPLSAQASPPTADLVRGWLPWLERLDRAARRWDRPVLFTECGYKSSAGSAVRPWEWDPAGPLDLDLQSRCYEAMFQSLWLRPWFRGLFLWKWSPDPRRAGGPDDRGFTPQRKPAEDVARRWFRGPG